eukprot:1050013-Prymnesium_polylepis.2
MAALIGRVVGGHLNTRQLVLVVRAVGALGAAFVRQVVLDRVECIVWRVTILELAKGFRFGEHFASTEALRIRPGREEAETSPTFGGAALAPLAVAEGVDLACARENEGVLQEWDETMARRTD